MKTNLIIWLAFITGHLLAAAIFGYWIWSCEKDNQRQSHEEEIQERNPPAIVRLVLWVVRKIVK